MAEIKKKPVQIVETVLRDAHQSLVATRMTTEQMLPIIDKMDPISILYFLSSKIASTNPRNNGCALFGRDFNSGCACVPTKNG